MSFLKNVQLRSAWLGAFGVLFLIWTLWALDLHPNIPDTTSIPGLSSMKLKTSVGDSSTPLGGQNALHGEVKSNPISTTSSLTVATASSAPLRPLKSKPNNETTTSNSDRPLILYAYFETELARINLKFFLAHALHDAADFLFIFNGPTNASDLLPDRPNISFLHRENDCYDLGAFAEVLIANDRYKAYNRFITMNASIRGPFFPVWANGCWSDLYLREVTDEVKLVGMTMNCRPVHHIQSMIWATDRIGLETLLFPSPELIEKFKESLPVKDPASPVPAMETPGINSCPHEYWKAVAIEVYATPLIKAAGYKVDAMMTAFHSATREEYEKQCVGNYDGDVLSNEHYYGISLHPYDTIFAKTNRGNDPLTLERMTDWVRGMNYSSYDHCH